MSLDTYETALEANAPAQPQVNPEFNDTTEAIFADKEKTSNFLKMLGHEGADGEAIAEGFLSGDTSKIDFDKMEEYRVKFNERREALLEVKNGMSEENIAKLAKYSPEFQAIVNQLGPKKAQEFIKNNIENVAFGSQDGFEDIIDSLSDMAESEKLKAEVEKETAELAESYGIDQQEYLEALAIPDPDERQEAIAGILRDGYGTLTSWIIGKKAINEEAEALSSHRAELDAALTQRKADIKYMASLLAGAVNDNPEVKEEFIKTITGNKPEKPERMLGLKDAKEMIPSEDDMRKKWEKYKSVMIPGIDFATLPQAEKDGHHKDFSDMQKKDAAEKAKGKRGWFDFATKFFAKKIDTFVSALN